MRKVIDSNFYANPRLADYLRASTGNLAILCEYAGIEAYKAGNPVEALAKTLSILKNYPNQVIVLKAIRTISIQKIARSGYINRMIHKVQTRDFSNFCQYVDKANNGSETYKKEILKIAAGAVIEAERALDGAKAHLASAQDAIRDFSKAEFEEIRTNGAMSDDLFIKILRHVLEMTIYSHNDLGIDIRHAGVEDVTNTIVFRSLLCNYLMALRWFANGAPPRNQERIRNHVYDCGFAAYATLFDGLLSTDTGANLTYRDAKRFLDRIGSEILAMNIKK